MPFGKFESNMISDPLTLELGETRETAEEMGFSVSLADRVPGIGAHIVLTAGPLSFFGEYVGLTEDTQVNLTDIVPGTLAALGLGNTASAEKFHSWNLEAGYAFEAASREMLIAVGLQGVSHAEEGFPERRYMSAISMELFENTCLALEYRHDAYETDDRGYALTTQLGITF